MGRKGSVKRQRFFLLLMVSWVLIEQKVQECDATMNHSINAAGSINLYKNINTLLSQNHLPVCI